MSILGAIAGAVGSIFGASSASKSAEKINAQNIALQKEFAQQGVRWKVDDAKAAGIHPLYALGAQTHSFTPNLVGATTPDYANIGQNLGSAIEATRTQSEKAEGFQKTVQDLTLQKMGLENQVLATQLRLANSPGRGPGMPGGPTTAVIDGQPNSATTFQSGGVKILVNPNTPAQKWEDQYGEIGGEIGGMSNFITDAFKQAGLTSGPTELGRKARKAIADALAEAVAAQQRQKRDPIFNERFWQ